MSEHPAQPRIAALIELAKSGTTDPSEQVMDLLVAASAIVAAQGTVNGTLDCIWSGLPAAIVCQEEWFPPFMGPVQ